MRPMLAMAFCCLAGLLLAGAGDGAKMCDFARFDESQWLRAREDRFPSAGEFVQKDGFVLNAYPEGTSEADLYACKGGVGYTMRLLKDVEMENGRAELELSLIDRAAPSIVFRAQMHDGEVHGALYSLVIFNHSTKDKDYQGVNLWKWTPPPADKPNERKWRRIGYWFMPIPREERVKLGVEFKGSLIRVFVNGKEIGGMADVAALGGGRIGVVAMEGASRFYSFSATAAK